jgi:2-keto-4-pentenoate hydratase/2-oxohepta-3-ene-1,7-dioic acid hydratase in catechol pathway
MEPIEYHFVELGIIMRFATLSTASGPRAVIQSGENYVDLNATDSSLPNCVKSILADAALLAKAKSASAATNATTIPVAGAKYHSPIPNPQKVVCVGLNYRDHAIETNMPIPKEPVLFNKFPTALIGHGETIILPKVSKKVDFEAELVIVIGKRGRHISTETAMEHVAGYTIGHDVSARDWQLEKDGKQWLSGKTFDTFAPVGPVIVTPDELGDAHKLPIRLKINGKVLQNSNTNQLIFDTAAMVSYMSQVFTLEPGDLIFTGTPPGVGIGRTPPVWIQPGDVCDIEIDGIGVLSNPVAAE